MKKFLVILLGLAVVGTYAYVYRDWFQRKPLQIFHRITYNRPLPARARRGLDPDQPYVAFGFDRKVALTDLKIVALPEWETNKDTPGVWHLESSSNSVPVKGFIYGMGIRGMKPFVKGAEPQPLESNVTYRVFVRAGSLKGQHDFSLNGEIPAAP